VNPLQLLFAQAGVEQLGWALIHFLWQGAAIAAVYGLVRMYLTRSSPSARYVLGCVALAAMMAAPLITLSLLPSGGAIESSTRIPGSVQAAGSNAAPQGRPRLTIPQGDSVRGHSTRLGESAAGIEPAALYR